MPQKQAAAAAKPSSRAIRRLISRVGIVPMSSLNQIGAG